MPNAANCAKELDVNALKNKIKRILRRYFDVNDNGDPNPEFDEYYTAQNALDDIHGIVGDI